MNILKREIRAGLKTFIFWVIGLFVLVFAGLMKYTAIGGTSDTAGINELLDKFPRIVLAVMGMAGADINTLGGYYTILAYYALVCAAIYAISLGTNAVSRESFDRTYEFVFTKPRSRSYILRMKLLAVWFYLFLFSILNYVFSVSAVSALGISEDLRIPMLLFSFEILLVGTVFFALSAFLSAAAKKADKGALLGNLCFLFAFMAGIVYDMFSDKNVLKIFSPLKYLNPVDLLDGKLDLLAVVVCVALILVLFWGAFKSFGKKDLAVQ